MSRNCQNLKKVSTHYLIIGIGFLNLTYGNRPPYKSIKNDENLKDDVPHVSIYVMLGVRHGSEGCNAPQLILVIFLK